MNTTKQKSNTNPKQDKIDQEYKAYFKTKQIAKILEEDNNSKLILFPSVNGTKDEWLKMGGNSALFYKYLVAPRLNKKSPSIRPDTDIKHRFKDGIISIHWKDHFLENLAKLNLPPPPPHDEHGLLIVELGRKFTSTEIRKLANREKATEAKINQILKPKNTIPELYHLLLKLAKVLPPKIAKLREPYRSDFGGKINTIITDLLWAYTKMVDQDTENPAILKEMPKEMLENTYKLSAILIILNENNLLELSTIEQAGRTLVELKTYLKKAQENADHPKQN